MEAGTDECVMTASNISAGRPQAPTVSEVRCSRTGREVIGQLQRVKGNYCCRVTLNDGLTRKVSGAMAGGK